MTLSNSIPILYLLSSVSDLLNVGLPAACVHVCVWVCIHTCVCGVCVRTGVYVHMHPCKWRPENNLCAVHICWVFLFVLFSWGRISLWPGTSQSRFNWLTTEPQECIWLCVPNTRITSIHCHAQLLFTWVLGIKPRFTQALHWISCMPGPWTYSNEHIPTRAEVVFEIDPVKYI